MASRSIFWWIGASTLTGVMLSIPLFHGDLAVTAWCMELSRGSDLLQWWNDVAARSLFDGGAFGAQDSGYVTIILVVAAYFWALTPWSGKAAAGLRLFSGYYLTCMLLFLVTNRGLKAFFGRARPVDVLGGNLEYSPVWLIGPYGFSEAVSKGSFTSGHTTTAMFLLPLVFWFAHSSRRFLAWPVFWLAVSWGALVGAGRIIRGSHYPGDVLWAMIICLWICAFAAYRLFGLDRRGHPPAMPFCWEPRLMIWAPMSLLALFAAAIGIKQMVFEPAWYWPLATCLSALLAWTGSIRTASLARC